MKSATARAFEYGFQKSSQANSPIFLSAGCSCEFVVRKRRMGYLYTELLKDLAGLQLPRPPHRGLQVAQTKVPSELVVDITLPRLHAEIAQSPTALGQSVIIGKDEPPSPVVTCLFA
jgi:hypothetical protein